MVDGNIHVGCTVRLYQHSWYSGSGFMPTQWNSAGDFSEEAKIIEITDYHYMTPSGYDGVNAIDVSRKVKVMFPNGEQLEMPYVGQFKIIDNGDPLT